MPIAALSLAISFLFPAPAKAIEGARPAEGNAEVPSDISQVPAATPQSLRAIADQVGPIEGGRLFEIHRWDRFPSVIIMDLADFAAQDRMFSRLAFYLEKQGYRGRLLSDAEMEGKHGWNAHDYGPGGLVAFYNAAAASKFPLDPEELLLRDIMLREGIIKTKSAGFGAGAGAVLSISRESDRYARRLLLAHESYHGIFFTSADYRKLCHELWDAAPRDERKFIQRLLGFLGYDTSSRELAVNEFQAYLLQQPGPMLEAYVRRMAPLLEKNKNFTTPPVESVLPFLIADEKQLESFLVDHFGIHAGGAYNGTTP
jgi:hypothetical protein